MFQKEKLFIIFTDLDGTFLPLKDETFEKLADFIIKVQREEKVRVKLCPVTGRSAGYTCDILGDLSQKFAEKGLSDIVEYGAAEQGGVVVRRRNDNSCSRYIGKADEKYLKVFKDINSFVSESKYNQYFTVDEDRICSSFLKVRNEICETKSLEEIREIFMDLKKSLTEQYGEKIVSTPYRYLFDVTEPNLSKDVAINYITEQYQKRYNIVGFSYSGDAENDIKAFEYVSKIAEIPGINAHVITPSNIKECVDCDKIEEWKSKIGDCCKTIKISSKPLFEGVIEELTNRLENKTLFGKGIQIKKSTDDFEILKYVKASEKNI